MKQYIIMILGAILFLFGCQKEDINPFEDSISANETIQCTPLKIVENPSPQGNPILIDVNPNDTDTTEATVPPSLTFGIENISIDRDCLIFELSYSGGCEPHTFELVWNGEFDVVNTRRLDATIIELELFHENPGDYCEAQIRQTEGFDISILRSIPGKVIHIYIKDLENPIIYSNLLIS